MTNAEAIETIRANYPDRCFEQLRAAVDKAIKDLEAQVWIPCSERLPEVGQDILMSVGGMYTAEGCLREDGDWAQFRWDAILRKGMVDAWMSLPEPYREDGGY